MGKMVLNVSAKRQNLSGRIGMIPNFDFNLTLTAVHFNNTWKEYMQMEAVTVSRQYNWDFLSLSFFNQILHNEQILLLETEELWRVCILKLLSVSDKKADI